MQPCGPATTTFGLLAKKERERERREREERERRRRKGKGENEKKEPVIYLLPPKLSNFFVERGRVEAVLCALMVSFDVPVAGGPLPELVPGGRGGVP